MGWKRRAFVLPHRYAETVQPVSYPDITPLLEAALPSMRRQLDVVGQFASDLEKLAGPPPAPRWNQDWFARLDAAVAYSLIRQERPGRILEIGSGHSTRFIARAIADGALATHHMAIDPKPRASLDGLPVTWHRCPLQDMAPKALPDLAEGDVLFVDSSHLFVPGSDVDIIFGQLIGRFPAGVLVHVHDVFLPDSYPADWSWRGYNEQSLVAMLLTSRAEPVFASHWIVTRHGHELASSIVDRLPLVTGARETSFWLRLT
ncbi:MAG: class I SAM-dependent methyltransferase [Geminicoccaceae bacterium]